MNTPLLLIDCPHCQRSIPRGMCADLLDMSGCPQKTPGAGPAGYLAAAAAWPEGDGDDGDDDDSDNEPTDPRPTLMEDAK